MDRHGPAQSSKEQDGGGGGQHKKGLLLSNGRFSLITGIFAWYAVSFEAKIRDTLDR